uniref:Cathepsin propeptide inhibitor domain-containing protein n=1 Tax=Ditylenchus dipsaci TaxID=166011 RepID=A0A915DWD7_9BILA
MVVANLVLVVIFWFGVPASSTGDSRLEEGLMHLEPDLLAVFCRYIAHEWKVVRDANSKDSDHTATEFANLETVQHSTQMLDGLKHLTQQNYQDWEAYKELYEKSYNDENEEIVHMLNFLSAQQEVRQHNDAYARKEVTYKQEINYFADLVDNIAENGNATATYQLLLFTQLFITILSVPIMAKKVALEGRSPSLLAIKDKSLVLCSAMAGQLCSTNIQPLTRMNTRLKKIRHIMRALEVGLKVAVLACTRIY